MPKFIPLETLVSKEKIEKVIQELPYKKAPGPDSFQGELLANLQRPDSSSAL